MVITATASPSPLPEAALRTWLSVPPPGVPLTAPASGLRGLSLPGLAPLTAWGRKGTVASWLRTGAKAGEAGLKVKKKKKPKASRQLPPPARKREPACLRGEGTPFVVRSRSDRQRAPRGLYASPTARYGRGATCLESLVW